MTPITCAACGEDHIEDQSSATRVGIAFIARECSWTLRYPGKAAHEVIEALEARAGRAQQGWPQAAATDASTDEPSGADASSVSEDPAERAGGEFAETRPCPVCDGDGEVPDPEDPDSFNLCGRCNGDGTVRVTGG